MGRKYNYNKEFFQKIDTEEKAYWLGFLYADGCITRFYRGEKIRSMSLELSLKSSDKGHLFKFLNDLEANVPIQDRKHTLKGEQYYSNRVVINNTALCKDLIKQGCTPAKSLTLEFPDTSIISEEFYNHFIRGYFDGDGCVHYSENMQYYKHRNKEYLQKNFVCIFVGTESFLKSVEKVLEINGIKCGSIRKNKGKSFELRINGFDNIKKFHDYMYSDASVLLKRKKDIFEYAFKILKIA